MEEFEIKFLEVDVLELEKKLIAIGAKKIGETFSRVENFDFPDFRLKKINGWVRLRTEFDKTTLTYKERQGVTSDDGSTKDHGMKELEVVVGDFNTTKNLLFAIGLIVKFEQERKRIRWIKDDIEFDIDTWPLVPTYLEIEGPSMEKLKEISEELGLDWEKHFIGSFGQVCGIYGFSDHDYTVLKFDKQIKK